ncbi:hypothetical protein IFM89_036068 [Coptis chinensis]|uniref:MORF/ORRM1/DAG-like MORF domain-containing protein n=1 Tax=Coptis chinensis TaxID=261450 RepID=A0A835HXD4_9MAGN|nr:hypothetical protein IFM89_036068 [Coptis chinensis]
MALIATRRSLTTLITRTLAVSILNKNQNMIHDSRKIPSTPRFKTSGSGYSPLNDPSPNWSNRPPKETILLDGCDYEHWLIVMEFPAPSKPSEDEMVQSYVSTLSSVLGRPQYHYDQRQPAGHRSRPRYDRRRETMQNDRRGPMQRSNQGPAAQYPNQGPASQHPNQEPAAQYANQGPASQYDNQGPASQPAAMGGQNSLNTGERVPYPNQGNYSQGGA